MPVGCTSDFTSSSVLATVMDFDQRKLSLLLHQRNARRSTFSASAGANIVLLWSCSFSPRLCELLVFSECPSLSQRKHMAQLEGKSDGASLTLVPQSAARLSLVRSDGNSNPTAPNFSVGPSMVSISLPFNLLADAMAFGVHDAVHMTHDSQPVLKSYMKVNDQLRAFLVTQPSLKRFFRSNQPLATLSSYLDNVHRQHVILKLAAFNNFTTLDAYLSGTATHNKKISQFFDLVDAGPAPTFCTLYSLCLGNLSVEPTRPSAPSTLPSLSSRRLTGIPNTSSALHCLKLLSVSLSLPRFVFDLARWVWVERPPQRSCGFGHQHPPDHHCARPHHSPLKALANVKVYQAAGAWDIDCLMVEAAQRFGEHVSGAFNRDDFSKFVEAVFNSVPGPAELLYDHLVKECFIVTLYADNHLVFTSLLKKVQFSGHETLRSFDVHSRGLQPSEATATGHCTTWYQPFAKAQAIRDKLVQVYSSVLLDTIDVDILEHREHRTTVMVEYQHSNLEKKLVPGTNFKAKDGQDTSLFLVRCCSLLEERVNSPRPAMPSLLRKSRSGLLSRTSQVVQQKISLTDHDARIARLSADKDAVIDKLESTQNALANLIAPSATRLSRTPKKLQSSLTASEEKVKKLEAQQPISVNTAFISQPVADGTAWVGGWLGWVVQTSGEGFGGTYDGVRIAEGKDKNSSQTPTSKLLLAFPNKTPTACFLSSYQCPCIPVFSKFDGNLICFKQRVSMDCLSHLLKDNGFLLAPTRTHLDLLLSHRWTFSSDWTYPIDSSTHLHQMLVFQTVMKHEEWSPPDEVERVEHLIAHMPCLLFADQLASTVFATALIIVAQSLPAHSQSFSGAALFDCISPTGLPGRLLCIFLLSEPTTRQRSHNPRQPGAYPPCATVTVLLGRQNTEQRIVLPAFEAEKKKSRRRLAGKAGMRGGGAAACKTGFTGYVTS
ncbi:hypothetical protein KCU79_g82, partial [Aureobasidium melanogenum]